MKIHLLSKDNPFAVSSASSNRYIGLLKGLAKLNCNIIIVITGGYYHKNEKADFGEKGIYQGLSYIYLNTYSCTTLNKRRLYEYFLKPIIYLKVRNRFRILKQNKDEKLITWIRSDIYNFRLLQSISKKSNERYFMEINEFPDIHLTNNSTRFFWQRNAANAKHVFFETKILPQLDGLALMTKTLMDYFEPKLNSNTRLLHLPMTVDLERFDLKTQHENTLNLIQPYISFVGSMNDAKDGVSTLIEAFQIIAKDFPEVHLNLFGFWAYDTQKHRELISKSGLKERILYSKEIGSKEVINVLMNAELLVLPRPNSHQARGGFPTKLGEYLATSKPVVSTRVGEISDYLNDQESVFFCDPGSVQSLAAALKKALTDSNLSKEIGLNGRKVAENEFSALLQSKRLYRFLQGLM
jgi:glycosyltransferase involved in cell wall biosynthesis